MLLAYGLVIFDVAGATAQVTVERRGNSLLEIGAGDGLLGQTFQQDLTLVQKTRSAIPALKSKMLDESFLQNRKLAVFRVAFDRSDGFTVEACRRNYAAGTGIARPIRVIDDHHTAQALRGAAAELGAGQPWVLAQEGRSGSARPAPPPAHRHD